MWALCPHNDMGNFCFKYILLLYLKIILIYIGGLYDVFKKYRDNAIGWVRFLWS